MATKKELLQAQTFSRRRLLTAFVSGAPGGRELEPAKPLRGVVIGGVLSVLVVVGSLIAGIWNGSPDDDWKVNSLVVVSDTGARYIAINGELYPVHNVTSALLLKFSDSFEVLTLSEEEIQDVPRGTATVGIPGAPDALPPADNLINDGWLSCAADTENVWTSLRVDRPAPEEHSAALVEAEGDVHYVHGQYRYRIADEDLNALSHFMGFDPGAASPVSAQWLNIFEEAAPLRPLVMEGAGDEPPAAVADLGAGLEVGSVVLLRNAQGETGEHYVVNGAGRLVELTPLSLELYYLGSEQGPDDVTTLDLSEAGSLEVDRAAAFVPLEWPEEASPVLDRDVAPCVQLHRDELTDPELEPQDAELVVVEADEGDEVITGGVQVEPGHGALVRFDGGGTLGDWAVIDERGMMYLIPVGSPDVLQLLGYAEVDPPPVPAMWSGMFPPGPVLTVEAARLGLPTGVVEGVDEHVDEPEEEEE